MLFSLNWIFRRISTRTKHHDSSQTFSWFVLASLISRKWRNKPNLAHSLNHQQLIHWKSYVIWWGFELLLHVVNSSVTIIFTQKIIFPSHTCKNAFIRLVIQMFRINKQESNKLRASGAQASYRYIRYGLAW